jgi:hypothetical protein
VLPDEQKQSRETLQRPRPFWKLAVRSVQAARRLKEKAATDRLLARKTASVKQPAVAANDSVKIVQEKKILESDSVAEEPVAEGNLAASEQREEVLELSLVAEQSMAADDSGEIAQGQKILELNPTAEEPAAAEQASAESARKKEVLEFDSAVKQPIAMDDSDKIVQEQKKFITSDAITQERFTVPPGYKLHNVPGDGLCGYWATLAAQKACEFGSETSIKVEKKEVSELLRQLSDYIAHILGKENKTDKEMEMSHEIEQLFRDGYAKNNEDLYQKIEKGQMQLDSPLAIFLAQMLGYNIILEWEGMKDGKNVHVQERYRADNAKGTIIIYYSGNGSGGHYQAIVPNRVSIHFDR